MLLQTNGSDVFSLSTTTIVGRVGSWSSPPTPGNKNHGVIESTRP